jgi:hypothetical protein
MTGTVSMTKNETAMNFIEESAKAIGGVERIRDLHTLHLYGYAQYAYMWGGGNITASPDAPQKLFAANDLQRVWNFDHDGFQLKERRNMLFPFAAVFGHGFFPLNQVLDGEVAYNKLPNGDAVRVGYFSQDPLCVDGRRIRKLWSLTNPASVLNAILNQKATICNHWHEHGLVVFDIVVDEKIKLILAINQDTKMPEYVQWNTAQTNLGEITFVTTFTGYMPFNGILLPMGYNTKMDFRDIVYFRMIVDGYKVDEVVEDLKAPADVAAAFEPTSEFVPPLNVETIDEGIWRIAGIGGTTVIEFEDHLTIFELYWGQLQAKAIIEKANTLVPGKKVTELIISHYHFDHTGGFRAAVAAGLKVISCRGNEGILREMAERLAPDFPDVLEPGTNRAFEFIPVDQYLKLSDKKTTVEIFRVVSNNHMADAVFAYLPDKKLFLDSDIATAASDWQLWPDSYLDNLDTYGLQVDKVSTVHEKVMTHNEILEYIESGRQRALERGAKDEAMNEYLPGYPIFQTR